MKTILKILVFMIFLGILVIPVALIVLTIEKTPAVSAYEELSLDNINRVKALIKETRAARMKNTQNRMFKINENDLNLLVSYAMSQSRQKGKIYSKITLSENNIHANITVVLPATPLGEYVNISLKLTEKTNTLDIASLGIGKLFISGNILNSGLNFLHNKFSGMEVYENLLENADAIEQIIIKDKVLSIFYQWDPKAFAKLNESSKPYLMTENHQKKLIFYYNNLSDRIGQYKSTTISLAHVLPPLFKLARQQSSLSGNPVLENRALLQAMALYSIGKNPKDFVRADLQKDIAQPAEKRLVLKRRRDLPKHYLVSAGLSVSAGSKFANFIGLAKEVDDSDKGTGFSFADLAADRAGVKLADLAGASDQSAAAIQLKMASVTIESDFMPAIDHLPEGIMALEFKKRYVDLDSKSYALVNDEITKRIGQCSAFQ